MHDYTFGINDDQKQDEARNKFILKYKIKYHNNKKKIIVYLANHKKVVFDYTKELEQGILNAMKENVYNYKEIMDKVPNKEKEQLGTMLFIFGALWIIISLISTITSGYIKDTSIMSLFFSSMLTTVGLKYNKNQTKRYKDFKKNMLFLENEARINQSVLENTNTLKNIISKKSHNKIVMKPDGNKGFTINSIDKMSLNELKRMIELIKLQDNNIENEKSKTKTLK